MQLTAENLPLYRRIIETYEGHELEERDGRIYIDDAEAGCVLPEPFAQAVLDATLAEMLGNQAARRRWQAKALAFAETADIYSNAERAADIILKARP